jgi:hypothetical protein
MMQHQDRGKTDRDAGDRVEGTNDSKRCDDRWQAARVEDDTDEMSSLLMKDDNNEHEEERRRKKEWSWSWSDATEEHWCKMTHGTQGTEEPEE